MFIEFVNKLLVYRIAPHFFCSDLADISLNIKTFFSETLENWTYLVLRLGAREIKHRLRLSFSHRLFILLVITILYNTC